MYICCVLHGNIHIFTATQRDGPYQGRTSILDGSVHCYEKQEHPDSCNSEHIFA